MDLIEQSWQWLFKPSEESIKQIEKIGRTCYKSEGKITPGSADRFVKMILKNGHESVIEHCVATVKFITNRGVTHELVRHRLASFSQESTRYVKLGGKRKDIQFIKPVWFDNKYSLPSMIQFRSSCYESEATYNQLIEYGWTPEQAREVLPNALKTEIVVTANLREWRHIFKLRTSKKAHPQIRALMQSCCDGFKTTVPIIFDDITY